jgi:hypothetical protein
VWQSSLLNGGGDVENLLINYRAFERNGEKGYNANYVIANLLPERDTGEGLQFFFRNATRRVLCRRLVA